MNGTTDKTKTTADAGHGSAATVKDALDKTIVQLEHAAPIRRLREDLAERDVPMRLIRGDEAPVSLRGRRPQVFVDTKIHKALCIVVSDPEVSISDILYVGAEALATAYEFPREPGDKVHEALVNSFALTYVSDRSGSGQALRSYRLQLDKLQRSRLQGQIDEQLRRSVALRCWAIGTALDIEAREPLLGQVETVDADTAELVVALTRAWGSRAPATGVEASGMLAASPF